MLLEQLNCQHAGNNRSLRKGDPPPVVCFFSLALMFVA